MSNSSSTPVTRPSSRSRTTSLRNPSTSLPRRLPTSPTSPPENKSPTSPRPLPRPRPAPPPVPVQTRTVTEPEIASASTSPVKASAPQLPPIRTRTMSSTATSTSIKGPRQRINSPPTSPSATTSRVFISAAEGSPAAGSGSKTSVSSQEISNSSIPVIPTKSPLRKNSILKSADKRDDMKHHEPRSSSRGAPQHMASLRSPAANPASPAAAVPSKSKSKSESLMISNEGLDVTAVATVRSGSSSTDRFSHSISKPSSSPTTRTSSSSSQAAASSSTRAPLSTKKSRTLETDAQRSSMVRSAVTRSHSASASTSPVGPRPPSSHKFPSMTQSSLASPSTPAKERLQKQFPTHSSVAGRCDDEATASSAPPSTTKSHSFSTPNKTAANSRNGRPSTAATISTPSEPVSTPPTRGRGRSGTVIATPSSAPSTSYSHSQLLSPSSPSGSPQAHSLLSSPLSSMLVSTPLSRSHRLSTTSEVSPVHLKRLLAEPAGASCASAYGSGSENEVLGAGIALQRKRLGQGSDSEGYKSAPGGLGSGSRNAELKGRQRWLAKMQRSFDEDDASKPDELANIQPALRLVQSLDTPPSSPPANSAAAKGASSAELDGNGKEKKIRNVLKRRPSAGFGFLRRPATSSGSTTLKSSGNFLSSPVAHSPLPISPGLLHSPGMSHQSRSPSRDGSERSGSRSGPASVNSLPPRSLTPAALLALEYREQEARREDIVDGVAETHSSSPSHSRRGASGSVDDGSLRGHDRKRNLTAGDEDEAGPGAPYYTVFGSRSGRVVAVGSPYDAWGYDVDAEHVRGRDKSVHAGCGGRRGRSLDGRGGQGSNSKTTLGGVGRTLQRKVSGRFRGEKGTSKDAEESGDMKGRGGVVKKEQEKFSFGAHKRRSLRLSIDKFAEPDPAAMPAWPASPRQPTVEEGAELQPATEDTRRKTEPGFLGGGKIWKLMKRLSTGGLREKYAEAPPPVPALPKELLGKIALGGKDAARTQDPKNLDLSRLASRQSSASAPTDPPLKKHASAVAKLSNTGAVVFAPRPSLNTRSSSPVSSELASLRFFRGNQSSRSSTSSLFEDDDPPPLPMPSMISQHIIPPSEFNRADTSEESVDFRKDRVITKKPSLPLKIPDQRPSRSLSNDWLPTKSPYDEIKPSLPLPPRRTKGEQKSSRPPSPIIPSFSTVSPINDFAPRKPSLKPQRPSTQPPSPQVATISASMGASAPLLSTPPPPRPSRSVQRPSPNASASSSRVASPARTGTEPYPSIDIKLETPDPPRLSLGSRSAASTSKTSRQRSSSPSSRRRTMIYKNMTAAQKSPMLTDKEKDDKWNDLLERSARAGGTLHIGGAELLSDRLSTLSMDSSLS
ncbi:hypothetical protein EYR40_009093 [Pleurotus pulmonarius]|nr:hypothetical protein EYR36_009914 [Pleurotus pulmonarius]KAF4594290.1 hypothetical protein EYR40_009093 [Pleurotus pulmonarius]